MSRRTLLRFIQEFAKSISVIRQLACMHFQICGLLIFLLHGTKINALLLFLSKSMWEVYKKGFKAWLQLEKSLSPKTVEAYLHDVGLLTNHLQDAELHLAIDAVSTNHIEDFLTAIHKAGLNAASQARIISGLRSFFKYCLIEQIIEADPTRLIESPRQSRKLPDTLSFEEIEAIIGSIDLSRDEGIRNKAILETMYSCGLRVSEVTELKLSQLFLEHGYIRVTGKGSKERLIPIGSDAVKHIQSCLLYTSPSPRY